MSSDSTTPTTDPETHRIRHTDLTMFQIDLLAVCARLESSLGEVKGLAIKDGLEDVIEKPVNHGRLYPNLDELATKGLIEKGKIDDRSNFYRVTEEGFRVLDERRDHIARAIDGGA
ncbi:PadR family transcriptional regulator [Halorubrum sodomense]|uniref:Transcriptional regulator PadR-like family protein n=1 Tax=Halorubrum sodomense TaxID=35743 RepID=A0A1I6HKV9_HALSD|nr:PadR family transcriptional regulator [Halorubrum sodomense]SFR54987.1 Transcriptional regulator PadR-like family protein [Halorubrum sodomense]